MRKMMIVLGLVAVVFLVVTFVYAQGSGYGRSGWGYEKWPSLTPKQLAQLGPGGGMGPSFGGGCMMGYGSEMGCGYGRGPGYGMSPGYGVSY